MYQSRETNPHFQPRTQQYAQPHDPDDPTVPLAPVPQRFRPSPPHQSSPPIGPNGPSHSRPPTTTHHGPGVSPYPAPVPGGLPHSRPTPTTHHGPGVSHYPSPPLRVPPQRKTKGLAWLVAICCALFWIIIILGALILLIIYLAYRPHYPKFDISSASLNAAYLDLGYLLNGDMTLLANFTNPNKKVNVEFRYMVVNLYFEGTLIAAKYVDPLSVSPRGYKLRDVHMVSSQVPVSRKHVAELNEQIRTDRIMFEARSYLRTTSNIGGFFRYSYWLYGHCKFVVSAPPSGILVTQALAQAGLESSNLIVGIDFTKSNEWTGKHSFNNRSLHSVGTVQNPYEQAISIIGQTLSAFDEDNLIPCFGFGDASTHDQSVFSFYSDSSFCQGFEDVLRRYREIVPELRLSGPTSFGPIIEMATTIVEESGGQYHVLLIIADGQVTRSVDTENGQFSSQERSTIDAIVKASNYPLSIIVVGVGDGPWDMMKEFDDNIPSRVFDNIQFVNFTEIMSKNMDPLKKQTEFALTALMEIPSQYKATLELGLLGVRTGHAPNTVPLPPPCGVNSMLRNPSVRRYGVNEMPSPSSNSTYDHKVCPVCRRNPKEMAFNCGHQTCCECGVDLMLCPTCRNLIANKLVLY
ncbi:von Willebrand factor, type A, Copine, Zinc finger, RING/FYVE/PHD-type [Artemisia annua]|uniref:von Willebrand factor, type A, Copine, Zinc finger, RING/FYVE/PHD-type n=1 Tax=Artemisia annua TaxID=35608 RepID=A0A2U1MQ65_ARTAN|nr:von Willebrand factor, type A, Copine, Zinc finger, RING/FYVE/PHD-type [Artemisia annua]